MAILFLDDSSVRTTLFRTKYPEAVCVTTSVDCIAQLKHCAYDLVCLDYDLEGGETAMNVVAWILADMPFIRHIVVHSTNLPASLHMIALLRGAGYAIEYVPFCYEPGGPFHL